MVFVFGCNALLELSIYIFGICAPFLITFSSVGNENSDGGKASAPDYISVCLLFIFIIVYIYIITYDQRNVKKGTVN